MKEYFVKSIRGHQFEFKRVSSSSFDQWYHISAIGAGSDIEYRMHDTKNGVWKLMSKRIPTCITDLETEFNEVINGNENA